MTYNKCRNHVERHYRSDFHVLRGILDEGGGHDSGRVSVSVEGVVELCLPFYVDLSPFFKRGPEQV